MIGETAELAVLLKLNDQLSGPLGRAGASLGTFNRQAATVHGGLQKIGAGFATLGKVALVAGAGIVGGLAAALKSGVEEFNQQQTAAAQTAAVIKSTGQAAHVTAQQIRDLATATQNKTAIDADQIQAAENLLLTFTNIRNEVGKGNDIFNQATQTVTDLSVAFHKDLNQSAVLLGKALQDPVKGLTSLSRIGIQFSAQEQAQIRDLIKHNDLLGAQKVILQEINRQVSGSAAAKAGTFAGQQERLALALKDLKVAFAGAAIPGLTTFAKSLADVLTSPDVIQGAKDLGKAVGGLFSAANLKDAVQFARDVLPGIADGLKLAGTAAKGIFDLWSKLPKELQGIAIAALIGNKLTGGLVASGVGDLLKVALKGAVGITAGVVNVNGGVVNGGPGTGTPGGVPPIIPLALITVAAVGVAKQVIDANEFRNQRANIGTSHPGLTNAEALALQLEKRGGLSSLDRRSAEGAITAFRNEATSYAEALASAHRKLKQDAADLTSTARALSGGAKDTGRRNQNAADMKAAVHEGNRDVAQRRDMSNLQTTIGLGLRKVQTGISQVEMAGLREVRGAVGILQSSVVAALGGGFGSVVQAIHGISLPAFLGTAAQQGRGTGAGGRPSASPAQTAAGAPVGIEKNRGSRNLNVFVKSSVSSRSVDSAGATQSRYGPTPTRAGAAVVLVS